MNTYAIVTPVRNETENLRRLAESLSAQSLRPKTWMVVDTGSDDGTPDVITELMREHDWIATCTSRAGESPTRARAIVHGFNVGVIELGVLPEVVVKLDADVSMKPDYFERLLSAGILARPFADAPARLRFGIPPDENAWERLALALRG